MHSNPYLDEKDPTPHIRRRGYIIVRKKKVIKATNARLQQGFTYHANKRMSLTLSVHQKYWSGELRIFGISFLFKKNLGKKLFGVFAFDHFHFYPTKKFKRKSLRVHLNLFILTSTLFFPTHLVANENNTCAKYFYGGQFKKLIDFYERHDKKHLPEKNRIWAAEAYSKICSEHVKLGKIQQAAKFCARATDLDPAQESATAFLTKTMKKLEIRFIAAYTLEPYSPRMAARKYHDCLSELNKLPQHSIFAPLSKTIRQRLFWLGENH